MRFDLVAVDPIAGGQVVIDHAAGVTVEAVVALRSGLVVRAATVGGQSRVGWVGLEAESGPQVQVSFTGPDEIGEPTVGIVRAYASSEGADLGSTSVTMRSADAVAVAAAPAAPMSLHHPEDPTLDASFAAHSLGDLNADGTVGVQDALLLLDVIVGGGEPFTLYHSDLDGDGVTDLGDAGLLLDKIVDPALPAGLHVKPRRISFVQLDPDTDQPALVLVGNRGNQPLEGVTWNGPWAGSDVSVTNSPISADDGTTVLTLAISKPTPKGWAPGTLTVSDATGANAEVLVGNIVLLVAGQSNAVGRGLPVSGWPEVPNATVRMLGNDYVWKHAQEPLDSSTNQVDSISEDPKAAYSFGTRLGTLLYEATGHHVHMIPAAAGGTKTTHWAPTSDRLDTGTLFGSANFRAQVTAGNEVGAASVNAYPHEGGPVSAIVWYQGESDNAKETDRAAFIDRTNVIMNALDEELGAPVVYVQLATQWPEYKNLGNHAVAESQRAMETGYGASARDDFHMVVAHDLPMSDDVHVSAFGHRVLAERIDLAIRQHVFGEAVDGTGPRLVSITHSGTYVYVKTTRTLAGEPLDRGRFTVFDGYPNGTIDDPTTYGDNFIEVLSVVRDPDDPMAVRITLASEPQLQPHVRYMSPGRADPDIDPSTDPSLWTIVAAGVVRDATSGLPLPVFGPTPAWD